MQFVKNIHTDEKSLKLVHLIMEIAKYMNIVVVAEGVENEEQYKLLKQTGVDVVQGYYFSRPLPAEEFTSLINN